MVKIAFNDKRAGSVDGEVILAEDSRIWFFSLWIVKVYVICRSLLKLLPQNDR
jgi:hypothetical protein